MDPRGRIPISELPSRKGGVGACGSFARPGSSSSKWISFQKARTAPDGQESGWDRRSWGGLVSSNMGGGIGCDGREHPATGAERNIRAQGDFGAFQPSVSRSLNGSWEDQENDM